MVVRQDIFPEEDSSPKIVVCSEINYNKTRRTTNTEEVRKSFSENMQFLLGRNFLTFKTRKRFFPFVAEI